MADNISPTGLSASAGFGTPTAAHGIFPAGLDASPGFGAISLRAISVTITDNSATTGEVNVAWTVTKNALQFWSFRIYVRETGLNAWTLVYETQDTALSQNYDLWQFANGVEQTIKVVEVTRLSDGSLREGTFGQNTVTPDGGGDYWLIDPYDAANNITVNAVTTDTWADSYEQATYYLIGKGNKVDQGSLIGRNGTLTLSCYDSATYTVRQQWIDLENLRNTGNEIFIRSPFGDLIKCVINEISWDRTAGTGLTELRKARLSYTEVS